MRLILACIIQIIDISHGKYKVEDRYVLENSKVPLKELTVIYVPGNSTSTAIGKCMEMVTKYL